MSRPSSKSFPLSLLRRRAEEEAASLPALLALARQTADTVASGDHARRRAGAGEKFWQFRDYHPGDRPQDIDWRQSAKGDRVFIRQKEWQTPQTTLLWAAGGPGMDYRSESTAPSKREAALTLSLAAALLMTRAGERIGLLDGSVTPGRSEANLQQFGQRLLDGADSLLPPASQAFKARSQIILAGDFLSPPEHIAPALESLAAQAESGILIQILDPAELALPFSGRVIFEDMGSGEQHSIAHVAAIREAYRQRLDDHLARIETLCRRLQWQYLLHTTDMPPRDTLEVLWRFMTQRGVGEGLSS